MDPKSLCIECKCRRVKHVNLKDELLELSADKGLPNCFESTYLTSKLLDQSESSISEVK